MKTKLRHSTPTVNTENNALELKLDDALLQLRKLAHLVELQSALIDAYVAAPATDKRQLLTIDELCEKRKLSRSHLHRLRKLGLPTHQISTQTVRFDLDEVDAWITSRRPA